MILPDWSLFLYVVEVLTGTQGGERKHPNGHSLAIIDDDSASSSIATHPTAHSSAPGGIVAAPSSAWKEHEGEQETPFIWLDLDPQWSESQASFTSIRAEMIIGCDPSLSSRHLQASPDAVTDAATGARGSNLDWKSDATHQEWWGYDTDLPMLSLTTSVGGIPSMNYTGDNSLVVWDERGKIPLRTEFNAESAVRSWWPERKTEGDVHVQFEVTPHIVDIHAPLGPRVDFKVNGGGLIGTGNVFVPTVASCQPLTRSRSRNHKHKHTHKQQQQQQHEQKPMERETEEGRDCNSDEGTTATQWNLTVNWRLSEDVPSTTRTVWSYGEGLINHRIGTSDVLVDTVYAVGPSVRSYTRTSHNDAGDAVEYGFYWLSEPTPNVVPDVLKMAKQSGKMFRAFNRAFEGELHEDSRQLASTSTSYRIFLQEHSRGYGGGAFKDSFILAWDRGYQISDSEENYYLLAHETTHNWPRMQGSRGEQEDPMATWYLEGIAEYLSILLSYETGLVSAESFAGKLSDSLSSFYTSPAVNMSLEQAAVDAWSNTHAQRLPYYVGTLFAFRLDGEIRRRSHQQHSLMDPVRELLERQHQGLSYTYADWNSIVSKFVGEYADEQIKEMAQGGWTVPPPTGEELKLFGRGKDKFVAVKSSEPVYDRGFDVVLTDVDDQFDESSSSSASATTRKLSVVKHLVPGSNAADAGIQEGDILTWKYYNHISAMDRITANTTLSLQRRATSSSLHRDSNSDNDKEDGEMVEEGGVKDFVVSFLPRSKTQFAENWRIEVVKHVS